MAAHPGAFGILIVYAVLWFIFDRDSFNWHAGATLIVWFMTLLIQRAEHRDTQALQAKIDELLHANAQADSELTKIDEGDVFCRLRQATCRTSMDLLEVQGC